MHTTKENKAYLEDTNDGDMRKDTYHIRDCPYVVKVKGFSPFEYEIFFRGRPLPYMVKRELDFRGYPLDCREIAKYLKNIAIDLGHTQAQQDIYYWHDAAKTAFDAINNAAKTAFDAINENSARHLEIVKENDELKKQVHGNQAEKVAQHNEIQRLRDMLDKQSLAFSKAWDQASYHHALGLSPIPELERLRRKNATLEREASNLRVKLDKAEGKNRG